MMGNSICSSVSDTRWQDWKWRLMELELFAQHNSDDHTRNISLGYLTKLLQKLGLHDKIDLFSEYAENNDSETIDVSDVFE